jgi:hypothetical protein
VARSGHRRLDGLAFTGLVDLHRVAVEGGVGEQLGGALEVQDGEPALAQVFAQAGAAADDLLEQRHRRMFWSSTMSLQVCASTPVLMSLEVVAITG